MGTRVVKIAAVDVLSVFAGFVLGAAAMTSSARAHLHPVVAAPMVWGVAVVSLCEYTGLRLIGEPYAGASSAALLMTLPMVAVVGALVASLANLVGSTSALAVVMAPSTAAVLALATPAATRNWVHAFCRGETGGLAPSANRVAASTGAGPNVLGLEDRR